MEQQQRNFATGSPGYNVRFLYKIQIQFEPKDFSFVAFTAEGYGSGLCSVHKRVMVLLAVDCLLVDWELTDQNECNITNGEPYGGSLR